MRLREFRKLIEDANKEFEVTTLALANSVYEVRGLQKATNKLNELEYLGIFSHDIERLKSLGPTVYYFKGTEDVIQLKQDTSTKVMEYIKLIKEKLTDFDKAIGTSLPEQENHSISVKLPDYNQIEELSIFFKKLDIAFHTALTIEEVKGSYSVHNFDSGSLWVEILVTSIQESSIDKLIALKMVGGVIKNAMDYYKQFLDIQITRNTLEKLRVENDALQPSLDALDIQIDQILEEKINKIYDAGQYSSESKASIKKSVKAFSELIGDGTEFYPSIDAPSEIVMLFPEESRRLDKPQILLKNIPDSE